MNRAPHFIVTSPLPTCHSLLLLTLFSITYSIYLCILVTTLFYIRYDRNKENHTEYTSREEKEASWEIDPLLYVSYCPILLSLLMNSSPSTSRLALLFGLPDEADNIAHSARGATFLYFFSKSNTSIRQVYLHVSHQLHFIGNVGTDEKRRNTKLTGSRENANDTNQVVIVDLSDANNVIRRPSKRPFPLYRDYKC